MKKHTAGCNRLGRRVFTVTIIGFLMVFFLAADMQTTDEQTAFFQERSIPVFSIETENQTIIAKLRLTVTDDVSPLTIERNNVSVFSKLAEFYPDSSLLRLEYYVEQDAFNVLEIDTAEVRRYSKKDPAGTPMLAHARMGIASSLQQRISSELEAVQSREEATEVSEGPSLPERTVALPEEGGFSGGGGGGGMIIPSNSSGTLITLIFFLFGSLILAFAIFFKRGLGQAPSQKIRASLNIYLMDGGRRTFTINEQRIRIGRAGDNSLVLHDDKISNHHAEILVKDGKFILRDLQSTNGTSLNGQKITENPLFLGDEILLGSTRLVLSE